MKRRLSILLILALLMALVPVSGEASGTLKYGSNGEKVEKVQTRLKELEYYFGNINGKFNKQTENAVKLFQKANGLKVTGEVNAATRKKLESGSALSRSQAEAKKKKGSTASAPKATTPVKAQATPAPTAAPKTTKAASSTSTLKYGTTNTAVKQAQQRLKELGYFAGTCDGKYDAETRDAVALFQKANKLTVNGSAMDAATRKKLASSAALTKSAYYATCAVGSGDSGYAVKLVQQRLKALGYYSGSVDGKYRGNTCVAVKKFQSANKLKVTGNCDYATRQAMNSDGAVRNQKAAVAAQPTPAPTPVPTAKPTAKATASPTAKATAAPTVAPAAHVSSGDSGKIETVISAAMGQLGKPYIFATSGMNSFDCSGLTMYCFSLVGVNLSHSAQSQGYQNLTRLTADQLQRGDLMCFNTNTRDGDLSDHVGIYLGNGTFIHASSAQGKVYISTLAEYSKYFSWGLRLL